MTDRPDPATDPWATDPTATQRTTVPDPGAVPPPPAPAAPPSPSPASAPSGASGPATGWGGPGTGWGGPAPGGPWRRERRDDGRAGSIVFGLILLAIGTWFFLEQTLGFELPELRWNDLWPVILIGIGLWIVLGAMRRER
jgi:hypothetical protein